MDEIITKMIAVMYVTNHILLKPAELITGEEIDPLSIKGILAVLPVLTIIILYFLK